MYVRFETVDGEPCCAARFQGRRLLYDIVEADTCFEKQAPYSQDMRYC